MTERKPAIMLQDLPPPNRPAKTNTRYLGLVIERDEEYKEDDNFSRKYIPIKDKYIGITKLCVRLVIDSYNRKSSQDLKRTYRSLR